MSGFGKPSGQRCDFQMWGQLCVGVCVQLHAMLLAWLSTKSSLLWPSFSHVEFNFTAALAACSNRHEKLFREILVVWKHIFSIFPSFHANPDLEITKNKFHTRPYCIGALLLIILVHVHISLCFNATSQSAVPCHGFDVCTAASPAGTDSMSGSSQPGGGWAQECWADAAPCSLFRCMQKKKPNTHTHTHKQTGKKSYRIRTCKERKSVLKSASDCT